MLSLRTSLRSSVAVLGVGIAIAASSSTPAFAANEGTYSGSTQNCAATEEIQLRYVDGAWHDWMELFPTRGGLGSGCQYTILNHNTPIWESVGAGSGWIYDGPGNYLCAGFIDTVACDLGWSGVCN